MKITIHNILIIGLIVISLFILKETKDKQFIAFSEKWEGMYQCTAADIKYIPMLDQYDPYADLTHIAVHEGLEC